MNIRNKTLLEVFPYLLIVLGGIGFLASFMLTIDKIALLTNPSAVLNCDINPILSCGNVMNTTQAETFGFANPLIGIAGFASIITIGLAQLAGATFKKWFWQGLQAGLLLGIIFMHYLFYQTMYRIGSLCPYCMVVWVVMIPLFWYTTLYTLRNSYVTVPVRFRGLVAFAQRHHADILIGWYLILIGLILENFWYYWQTLL